MLLMIMVSVDINGNQFKLEAPDHHILAGMNPNVGVIQIFFSLSQMLLVDLKKK